MAEGARSGHWKAEPGPPVEPSCQRIEVDPVTKIHMGKLDSNVQCSSMATSQHHSDSKLTKGEDRNHVDPNEKVQTNHLEAKRNARLILCKVLVRSFVLMCEN